MEHQQLTARLAFGLSRNTNPDFGLMSDNWTRGGRSNKFLQRSRLSLTPARGPVAVPCASASASEPAKTADARLLGPGTRQQQQHV